jgi:DNA-directed RNA polymerase specialized sigma54-like protein
MMNSLGMRTGTALQPSMSPRLQRAVRLLQMSSEEFAQTVREGRPLSDVELARQLGSQGLKVARRTVTKYRQLLRIGSAERRRGPASAAGSRGTPAAGTWPGST